MIGTEWNSPDGVRRIIGQMQHGGRLLWEVQTGTSRMCDLHDDTDLARVQARDAANLASRAPSTLTVATPAPITRLDQFLATLQPMKAGRARKSLERYTRINGANAATRAAHLERLTREGWRVASDGRLRHPERESFFTPDAWTSYGMEYAAYLTA